MLSILLIPALHYSLHSLRAQLNVDIHFPNLLQAGAQGFGYVFVAARPALQGCRR